MRTLKVTRYLMLLFGWGMFIGLPALFFIFPAGFQWGSHPESHYDPLSPYAFMLGAMYIAMALVLIRSAGAPEKHTAIIDYVIYSSVIHGVLMLFQSFFLPHELTHLIGDVPLLFMMAACFWYWHPDRVSRTDRISPEAACD